MVSRKDGATETQHVSTTARPPLATFSSASSQLVTHEAETDEHPGSSARGIPHQFATPRISNQRVLLKTAESNLRGLPCLRRTRVTHHGLLPVHRCPREQSPRSFPCHGQVTFSRVSSAMSVSSPQSAASQPLRQLRVVGTRGSAHVHPLLAKLYMLPSSWPESPDELRHSVGGTLQLDEHAARQFLSC